MIRRVLISATVLAASTLAVLAPAASADSLFGVIIQTPLDSPDVAPLREASPSSVRFLLNWDAVQPTKGPCNAGSNYAPGTGPTANNCDWSGVDQIVSVAAQAGTRGFPFLFGSPDWLTGASKATSRHPYVPPIYSASDEAAWRDFVSAAVDRYGPGGTFWQTFSGTPHPVNAWQVWNEPTSPAYFAPRPDVSKYVQLLKISHAAIKGADPHAQVVLAGVFGTPLAAGGGIDMPEFFKRLYAVPGAERYFDIAAVHPKHHTLTSTPKGQARLLGKAFSMFRHMQAQWHLAGVNWFSWRDAPKNLSSCAACPYAGLLQLDGTKKPAFDAFLRFN
jgi:hypothetical protein